MKYYVKINDRTYEVEIEDIHARPVVARVEGRKFEVTPENGNRAAGEKSADGIKIDMQKTPVTVMQASAAAPTPNLKTLTAPLPGTVVEVFVKPGEFVEAGHVMLIIEAMKMKNSIRSVRSGTISNVLVDSGQTVSHKQALVEFTE